MNIIDFGLGIRFAEKCKKDCLEELTHALCAEDVAGLELYSGEIQDLRYGTDSVFMCIFTKGKIAQMRRVFQTLADDAGITQFVCENMPFIQTNALEDLEQLTYLGEIREDGSLSQTQEIAFSESRTERKKTHEMPHGLVIATDCDDGLSARESIRALKAYVKGIVEHAQIRGICAAPKRMQAVDAFFDFGGGTAHMLETADGQTLRMGVLNGQIALLEAEESPASLHTLVERAKNEGLKQIWIDARFGMPESLVGSDSGVTYLTDERAFMQAQCDYGKIDELIKGTSFVCIVGPENATRLWAEVCERSHARVMRFGCVSSLEQLRRAVYDQWK